MRRRRATFTTLFIVWCVLAIGGCGVGCKNGMLWGSNAVQFRFVLDPSFQGEILAVEDPKLPLDYSRVYTLTPQER